MNRFNFRPVLIITLSLVLGILSGLASGYFGIKYFIIFAIIYLIIFSLLFFVRRKLKLRAIITYLLAFLVFITSSVVVFNKGNSILYSNNIEYEEVVVNGKITEINSLTRTVGLEDAYSVTVEGYIKESAEKLKLNFYFYTADAVYTGSQIKFKTSLNNYSPSNFKDYLSVLRNGYSYKTSNCYLLELSNPTNFTDKLKRKIQNNLIELVPETSGVIYALITGEEYVMYQDQMSNFRKLGVSHIFAVSGLHVGFLFSLISFILSLIKVKGKKSFLISAVILFLYVAFCGFSPSSIRALVIILVAKFATSFSFKNDKLNTYCFALLIVLLINPFNLINYGAILSFVAYAGIVFVSPTVTRMFLKILPESFARTLSTYLVAFFITLPVVLDYFDGVSLFASIFNFIIIPLISIIYPFALIGVILTLIITFNGFLIIPHLLIKSINYLVGVIFIDHFYIKDVVFKSSKIPYYLLSIITAQKINLTKGEKRFIVILLILTFILSFIAINLNGDIFTLKI